jgi:hypothetical protein
MRRGTHSIAIVTERSLHKLLRPLFYLADHGRLSDESLSTAIQAFRRTQERLHATRLTASRYARLGDQDREVAASAKRRRRKLRQSVSAFEETLARLGTALLRRLSAELQAEAAAAGVGAGDDEEDSSDDATAREGASDAAGSSDAEALASVSAGAL